MAELETDCCRLEAQASCYAPEAGDRLLRRTAPHDCGYSMARHDNPGAPARRRSSARSFRRTVRGS
jgi:hypothetical protein